MVIGQLKEALNQEGVSVSNITDALSNFTCRRNLEVQDFLRKDAISFDLHHRARTYLCTNDNGSLIGFFTLAIKDFEISETVSNQKRKKLTYGKTNTRHVPAYLIAQIAKDERVPDKIGGAMIKEALEYIKMAREHVGGRIVVIECVPDDKLIRFYEDNGFAYLQDNKQYVQLAQII
jgi:hypothetical protein